MSMKSLSIKCPSLKYMFAKCPCNKSSNCQKKGFPNIQMQGVRKCKLIIKHKDLLPVALNLAEMVNLVVERSDLTGPV